MSYANVSWEISTGDPQRAIRIANAAELALGAFNPARLLAASWLVDTEHQNVELIRRALDGVVVSFPQEFFYTVSDQAEADIQGIYPPFADLDAARGITGEPRNPRARPEPQPAPAVAAGARRTGRGRPRPAGTRRAGARRTRALPKTGAGRGSTARKPSRRKKP